MRGEGSFFYMGWGVGAGMRKLNARRGEEGSWRTGGMLQPV